MTRLAMAFVFATCITGASAQTIETNFPGLVLKNYRCHDIPPAVSGDLINRTLESFSGKIRIKIIDSENDIVFQTAQPIAVDPQNGERFYVRLAVGKCSAPNKVQVTLER